MSRKQETIDGILALGYEETHRSKKYRCFSRPQSPQTLLVGKSGALRVTRGPIAESRSMTGNKQHLAYAYVGRLSERMALTPETARIAWNDFIDGKVECT